MQEIGDKNILYDLGPTGIIHAPKRSGRQVPFIKTTETFVSKKIPKVFVHSDQVFSVRVHGDVADCFRYCHSFESMPSGQETEGVVEFMDNSYIAVEFGRASKILGVRFGNCNGPVQVYVGNGFADLIHKFTLDEPEGGVVDCLATGSDLYKLIVFTADAGTHMPAVELISNVPTASMSNKPWKPKLKHPMDMLQVLEGARTPMNDLASIQKSLFVSKNYRIDTDWVRSPDVENGVRFAPTLVNGEPLSIDDQLFFLKTKIGAHLDLSIYADDIAYGLNICWYALARYGNNRRIKLNKLTDKVFTDKDFVFENNMQYQLQNTNRVGLGYLNSIMLWPKTRITDPDAFAEAQVELFKMCKLTDISMPVKSIPMKPDRNLLYFAYRYGLDKVGCPPWDELVLQVCNDDELEQVLDMIGTFHLYLPLQKVTVLLDYPVWPGRWMGIAYWLMLLGIDKLVLTNNLALYTKRKEGWETFFEPNEMYDQFIAWIEEIKDRVPTQVQIIGDITRVASKKPKTLNWMEHFMLSWNSKLKTSPVINGEPLTMPKGNSFMY